jgi:hypothetical protein
MNGKKKSNWSLITLCAMLIAKYEHTYLKKSSQTINDGGLVALCQEVGGVEVARGWQKNMYKLLSIPYMPGSLICGYSTPPKFSALFLILWSCHFYIGMHTYGYKSCLITFVLGGCKLVNHDGCISELKSFVATLQVACAGLKMHHAWATFTSTKDYLSRFPHMTQLWQVI